MENFEKTSEPKIVVYYRRYQKGDLNRHAALVYEGKKLFATLQ